MRTVSRTSFSRGHTAKESLDRVVKRLIAITASINSKDFDFSERIISNEISINDQNYDKFASGLGYLKKKKQKQKKNKTKKKQN